jgi:K+/H+ antiporter YhaU regulatory subunit KhtT
MIYYHTERGARFMRVISPPPIYSRIALDIASKIARGEIREGEKLTGRSLTSSQYRVSPETVRRSFRLLADEGIVNIQRKSGATVLSRALAAEYVERFEVKKDMGQLKEELYELISRREELDKRIYDIIEQIIDSNERFRSSDPLRGYEFALDARSPMVGKTIGEANFWQNTGGTIVAIRRDGEIILSPGPYAVFEPHDTIIVLGDIDVYDRVAAYIAPEK